MITPESLEVILMSKSSDKTELFSDLHYIVIDEIHSFAESERGVHLMALLERIQQYSNYDIQRIGLSATVGNPEELLNWLQGSSTREKSVVYPSGEKKDKKIEIKFCNDEEMRVEEIIKRIFSRKALVFSNNRKDAEILKLKLEKENVESYIHHSSINKFFREKTEESFKIGSSNTIIATNTLELGIDIGALDIVLHLEMPSSVSSFLQKLGRTGRRQGKVSHFVFLPSSEENLVLSIAIVNLAIKKWVEDVYISNKAYDILFHQIITSSLAENGADIDEVFKILGKVYSFSGISYEKYIGLINFMVKKQILYQDKARVFLGDIGQQIFGKMNYMDLYSTFETPPEFTVNNKGKSIGTIEAWFVKALGEKFNFILGGRCWETVKIDEKKFIVYVEPSQVAEPPKWISGGKMLSFTLSQEYFEILTSSHEIQFLNAQEKDVLESYRKEQQALGLEKNSILVEEKNTEWNFYTYFGDKLNYTLGNTICLLDDRLELKGVSWKGFNIKKNKAEVTLEEIRGFVEKMLSTEGFFSEDIKDQLKEKLPDISFSKYQKFKKGDVI
jgi:ATP-dependent Lhr-like helicase